MECSVLVIDSDHAGTKLVRLILEAAGWTVLAVDSIAAARAALEVFEPHVVALETELRDGDGLAFAAELVATRSVPVVALTTVDGSETEHAVRRAGCVGFVRKPLEVDRLAENLAAFVPAVRARAT